MKCHNIFKIIMAFILLLVISPTLQAFVPDYPAAIVPGDHHTRITLEALDEIYSGYGYGIDGKPYTSNMRSARNEIAESNALVDHDRIMKEDPDWHCDDERLSECSIKVKNNIEYGIDKIRDANYSEARKKIGMVTHTLQDFYSHSNWVEMQGAIVNPEMGYGKLSNVATKNENTCRYFNKVDGIEASAPVACSIMDSSNIITNRLTSGYFLSEKGGQIENGVDKCFHGGGFDRHGNQGINKDANICYYISLVVSPHHDFHPAAATAAKNATVKIFQEIKASVDEDDFKKFLGFGPSLGFAIDTTGSMATEINGVKNAINRMIMNWIEVDDIPSNYVLSIINDPIIPTAFKTTETSAFLSRLLSLYAGYGGSGGDCSELYGQGAYNAVAALGKGSSLFAYTDASIKDPSSARLSLVLASTKNIKIINALSGSCEMEKMSPKNAGYEQTALEQVQGQSQQEKATALRAWHYDELYYTISEMTGGQVFIVSKPEAGKLAELSDIIASNYYTGLMSVGDTLTTGIAKNYTFYVDSRLDKLSISFSLLRNAGITVLRPDGSAVSGDDANVNVMALSQAVSYEIDKPAVGAWKINLEGQGKFTINVAGSSPLSFDSLKFVEYGGRPGHMGFYEREGYPLAGARQAVEATLSDISDDVHFEFRSKDGTLLDSVVLNTVDEYPGVKTVFMSEDVQLPTQPFRVYAVGKDVNNKEFQRVLSNTIAPQTVAVSGPEDRDIPLNTDTTYTFKVTNYGRVDEFQFTAVDDRGFVVSTIPASASIGNEESKDINVVVNPGMSGSIGTISTLTFMAIPLGDSAALGNYAIVNGHVVDKQLSVSLVQGSLITTGATIDDGGVFVWGFRGSGQQGNGHISVASKDKPERVGGLNNIVSLVGGAYHLLALDKNGTVRGWGQSGYGETGCKPASGIYASVPCKVMDNAIQITTGEYFSMALDKDGKVWTWGHNIYGQLGNGSSKNSQEPVQVNLQGEKARLIGSAYEGAFAVTEEGHVWAWGDNEASGLGIKGSRYGVQQIIRVPTIIPNLTVYANQIVYIAGGNGWGEALLDDGTVIGWGLHAALGQGTTSTTISSHNPVEILHGVKQLYARYVGSVALTEDGQIYTWGQTGGSAFKMIYGEKPTWRQTIASVKEIGGGKEHIFYKTEDNLLYGVGYNDINKLSADRCCAPNIDWPGILINR